MIAAHRSLTDYTVPKKRRCRADVRTVEKEQTGLLAVVRMARRTAVSRVRGDYFQDGRVPTGTTTISKRGEATR